MDDDSSLDDTLVPGMDGGMPDGNVDTRDDRRPGEPRQPSQASDAGAAPPTGAPTHEDSSVSSDDGLAGASSRAGAGHEDPSLGATVAASYAGSAPRTDGMAARSRAGAGHEDPSLGATVAASDVASATREDGMAARSRAAAGDQDPRLAATVAASSSGAQASDTDDPSLDDTWVASSGDEPLAPAMAQLERSVAPAGSLARQSFETRYQPGELLGEGGMGEVRLARDAHIGREVAVKTMRREMGRGASRASCARRGCRGSSSTRPSSRSTTSGSPATARPTSR